MPDPRNARGAAGQVLVLFAGGAFTIVLMIALLLDGGMALKHYRTMQDAADAAALAGANVMPSSGCQLNPGTTDPTPVAAVTNRAYEVLAANGYPNADPASADPEAPARATVECDLTPRFYNAAVKVTMESDGTRFVLVAVPVTVDATAMNGGLFDMFMSIITLSPSDCDSLYYNGTATLTFEGGVHVNSDATETACGPGKAALSQDGASGASSKIVMAGTQRLLVHGGHTTRLAINRPPITNAGPIGDPFSDLAEPPTVFEAGLSAKCAKSLTGAGAAVWVLEPGIYRSGAGCAGGKAGVSIPRNNEVLALTGKGVYIFDGVALVNNGGTICTLPEYVHGSTVNRYFNATKTQVRDACKTTGTAPWATVCQISNAVTETNPCGALLYFQNQGCATASSETAIFGGGAQGEVRLMPYFSQLPSSEAASRYNGFLLWTSRATPTTDKCVVSLKGGGSNAITGTVYTPTVTTTMSGSSSGSAAGDDVTVQFIVWNLKVGGGANLTMKYTRGGFAKYSAYGLVE